MQIKFLSLSASKPSSTFQKFAGLVISVLVAITALVFSAVLLAVLAVPGMIAWGYIRWKTRALRKQMRAFSERESSRMHERSDDHDRVFEGEVIRVVESANLK